MDAFNQPDTSWRHLVQDQEEDLVRELMQADDVDAVLARMEGDHFRHLSPVMRKLSSFDGPKQKAALQQQQEQQPQSPPPRPIPSPSPAAGQPYARQRQHPPPPPPPPPPEVKDARDYAPGRRGSDNAYAHNGPELSSFAPHEQRGSYQPHAASSSTYPPGRFGTDAAVVDVGDFSPAARPPPPPSSSSSLHHGTYKDFDPLDAYRRPATAPAQRGEEGAAPASLQEPSDPAAESRYHATMDSWLKPQREPPLDISRDSPLSSAQHTNPFAATRPPTHAAFETAPLVPDGMLPPPTPGSPWDSSASREHPRVPRVSTAISTTSLSPPRASGSRGQGEIGELENTSQSRIARQLQLLRNYRELAELCATTKNPSVDLFHALPSEELARMQAEQLEQLPVREQSPITVNNNYYFDAPGSRRGSGGGGRSGHSPGRSVRGRLNSNDTVGARSKAGAGPVLGNSRSVSELLTVDSHHGLTSHQPSGASSSQPPRPPLLPSPRIIPLQSPQPSSGPDSPVATPPLSQRGPPLAPPSPSRSYRARSHRSRYHDPHDTPTATTEEAGSSYDEDVVDEDEEADYAGDFMDNEDEPDGDDYDDGTAPRPPPPRIIEREQHRRFPNNSGNGDYSTSNAQPPLSPASQQQQQQQQLQQQQQQQQQQQNSYPGDYMATPSGIATSNMPGGMTGTSLPSNARSASGAMPPGASRSSISVVAGSDGGRRSVSSAINVLSGDQELRANAQPSVSGMVDSRRGSVSQAPPPQQRPIAAFNGNRSLPLQSLSHNQRQQRRSLSAGSGPRGHRRDGGAYTDPGMGSFSDLLDLRHSGGHSTPEKRYSGTSNGSSRGDAGRPHRGTVGNNTRSRPNGGSREDAAYGRRQGNRRGADGGGGNRGRGREVFDDDNDGSDYMEDDLGRGSFDNEYSVSEGDTPGNPQLQTHNPRSSAMRKRRQPQHTANNNNNNTNNTRAARTPVDSSAGRGRERGGWDDDGTVHTPRQQGTGSRQRPGDRSGGVRRQQGSPQERQQRQRRATREDRGPSSPFYGDDGGGMNSASTYSYSYTTSPDDSDYMARSYYSPIKTQAQLRGRGGGRGAGGGGPRISRSPLRGRGRGAPVLSANSPYRLSPQQQQQRRQTGAYPAEGNARYNSPQQMRGRGGLPVGAVAGGAGAGARGVERGRGSGIVGRPVNSLGGAPPDPFYNGAFPPGRGRGGAAGAAGVKYPLPVGRPGLGGPSRAGLGQSNAAPHSNLNSPSRSPRTGGASPAAAAAASPANAVVQLPNGMTVPANSPAGQQHRQLLQQQQQMQRQMQMRALQQMGMTPAAAMAAVTAASGVSGGGVPMRHGSSTGLPIQLTQQGQRSPQPLAFTSSNAVSPVSAAAMRRTPQMSVATSPMRGAGSGRAPSPSVTPSAYQPGRSVSSAAGGTAAHIHPGLLYGSLLPKARAKTALVIEGDDRGREHSVSPHGDATHEPFIDRGSVCPVQPVVPTFTPPRTVFNVPHMDNFPASNAIHAATADGVQPLAWKSGGSGCVVGRTGHLPPPPATKLSSHYVAPNAQQRRGGPVSGAASSVGRGDVHLGMSPPRQHQQGREVVSIMQRQQHFNPLQQSVANRRDSAFSLQSSEAPASAQQRMTGGVGSAQQRYVPLQEPLEAARGSSGVGRGSEVVDPYTPRGRAAAERSANLQRFGIAPVKS